MSVTAARTIIPNEERQGLSRWLIAAFFVLLAHGTIAYFVLHARDDSDSGSTAPPAIMIDLAPLSVAPAAEQMDLPEAPAKTEEAHPDEMTPTPDTPPPVEPPPEPQQMVQPLEPPPPEPLPLPPPPEVVTVPEAPLAPKPEAVLPPPPKPELPKPAPKPEKKVEKPVKHEQKPPAERTAAPRHQEAAPSQSAAGPSGQAASAESTAAWGAQVRARILAAKSCGGGGGSGVVTVSFTVNGGGSLGGAHLAGSSGNSALDAEAVGIVRRAGPFPPPPGGRAVSLSIPIHFSC